MEAAAVIAEAVAVASADVEAAAVIAEAVAVASEDVVAAAVIAEAEAVAVASADVVVVASEDVAARPLDVSPAPAQGRSGKIRLRQSNEDCPQHAGGGFISPAERCTLSAS